MGTGNWAGQSGFWSRGGAWERPGKCKGGGVLSNAGQTPGSLPGRASLAGKVPVSSPEGLESNTNPRGAGAGPPTTPDSAPRLPSQRGCHGVLEGVRDSRGSGQGSCPQASCKSQVVPSLTVLVSCSSMGEGRGFPSPRGIPESQRLQSKRSRPHWPDLPPPPCSGSALQTPPAHPPHPVVLMAVVSCLCGCHVPLRPRPRPPAPHPAPGQARLMPSLLPSPGLASRSWKASADSSWMSCREAPSLK